MNLPDFYFERKLQKIGYKYIAGVDEVGWGCFAGPVVAGCVVFSAGPVGSSSRSISSLKLAGTQRDSLRFRHPSLINDSKKLTSKQREIADKWIKKNVLAYGIGEASVTQINKLGIKKATEIAFRKAVVFANLRLKTQDHKSYVISYLLVDAFYIPYVRGLRRRNQKAIIKGDAKSISIAAASIIAKVYRDKLMV